VAVPITGLQEHRARALLGVVHRAAHRTLHRRAALRLAEVHRAELRMLPHHVEAARDLTAAVAERLMAAARVTNRLC